jgi:hypothetical protein
MKSCTRIHGKTTNRMMSDRRVYYVARKELAYLKFILEGHEGVASLTTLEPECGKVEIRVAPGRETEFDELLRAVAMEIDLRSA